MDKYKLIPALALVALAGGTYASEPVEPEQKLVEEGEEYEEVVIDPESVVEPIPMIPVIEIEEGRKVRSMESGHEEGALDFEQVMSATKEIVVLPEPSRANHSATSNGEKIYEAVEELAQFPGGHGALTKWIGENLVYPEESKSLGVEGIVIVQFVVEKDGAVSNLVVAKGIDKVLDKEAIRLVKKMPKWVPGRNNGNPVRSKFTMPVRFKLQH